MRVVKTKIFMIGPSLKTQGGISSVLNIYMKNFKNSLNLNFIPSYSGQSRIKDFALFAGAVFQVIFINIFHKSPIFHIHVASKGSYLRKSILAKICLLFEHKVIFHIHGAMFDKFIEESSAHRKNSIIALLNAVDRVVVLSESWFSYFSNHIPKNKLLVIYNPSSTFKPEFSKNYNQKRVRVLFMGRMGERKGIYDLINAVKLIKDIDFILNIYGDGDVAKVKELVEKEKLQRIITVNNWVVHSKINEIYENSDIMVLPSYAEGLPMSLLEAVGKGLALISTKVGGIPEIIKNGENGFLISAGDVVALSEKLKELMETPGLIEKMGKQSHVIAGEKFSVRKIEEQLQELYSSL